MATATASANIEVSASLIQSESRVQQTFTESSQMVTSSGTEHRLKKKKSSRRHKDEGTVSVSKSSEKLHKKLKASSAESSPACVRCARAVFAMERVKAERRAWHKECFRCHVCDKQLTVETYQSDQHTLYCKQHFKQLFEPKPVDEEDQTDAPPKKHQMIICESNPVELPPDVVRASDKPDLGLSSLSSLDVKARFQVFEQPAAPPPPPPADRPRREKSTQLRAKLAKFKAKGMDVGVSDEYLNGVTVEPSSSEPEEEDDADSVLRKSYLHSSTEAPLAVKNMSELVGKFETQHDELSERHRSRKQEIQNIRSRLFLGKQQKIKEMYEESVKQSEQSITSADKIARELEVDSEKSRAIKQRFESGEVFNDENQPPKTREYEDTTLFNEGIGKKSRSIFLELDANSKSAGPLSPPAPADVPKRKEIPFVPRDLVRSEDRPAEVQVQTADISDRFRFFETYKPETQKKEFRMTPPRQTQRNSPSPEPYVEPTVARADTAGDTGLASERHTASRMIHVFREMETNQYRDKDEQGPKPLKRFTPPPPGACRGGTSSSESGSSEDEDSEEEHFRMMQEQRMRDDALRQAQSLARTTSFRGRFENYREPERPAAAAPPVLIERDQPEDDEESQLETAKSLRAKFENMNVSQSVNKAHTRVNRFV